MGGQALIHAQPMEHRMLGHVVRHDLGGADGAVPQQVGAEALRSQPNEKIVRDAGVSLSSWACTLRFGDSRQLQ